MTEYPDPRRVVLRLADLRRLTILERARACAVAGIAEAEIAPLLRAVTAHNGTPETLERAVTLLYAIAYQLARRVDPATTWDDAQTWDLALDLETADVEEDAAARASVEASLVTGLPPAEAGELTLAQLDAYRELRPTPRAGDPALEARGLMAIGLVVEIIGDASKLAGSLDDAGKGADGFAGKLGGSAIKIAAVAGVAGIAAGAIAEMTSAAAADRDEQRKLEQAILAAGAATETSNAQVEEAITLGQARAFSDSETREAMQSLVTATGDVTAATALLGPAQDIARLAGVDLATAADAVAKAQAGQDGALRKLVPGMEKGATAADTLAAATAAAAGQADLYAESSEGMQKKAGDSLGELSETIGSVFLPILDAIIPALLPIVEALGTLVKAVLPILIPLVKVLAAALGIVANVLSTVVGWLAKLIGWLTDAIGKLGDFLASINPLKDFKLPSLPFLSSSTSSSGGGPSTRSGVSAASVVAPTINVYTTGDSIEAERAVVNALRRVTRLNGGVIPAAPGWTIG